MNWRGVLIFPRWTHVVVKTSCRILVADEGSSCTFSALCPIVQTSTITQSKIFCGNDGVDFYHRYSSSKNEVAASPLCCSFYSCKGYLQ